VSKALAAALRPHRNLIGEHLAFAGMSRRSKAVPQRPPEWLEVIGGVADVLPPLPDARPSCCEPRPPTAWPADRGASLSHRNVNLTSRVRGASLSMIILSVILSGMGTTERVTVTLSGELVEAIDRLERNRSRFIAEAVERELSRRRRNALLQSINNPHSETTEIADAGLGDWTSDLPDDEGLVDLARGTAVRWIAGQGWVKEIA